MTIAAIVVAAYERAREGSLVLGRFALTAPATDRGLGEAWFARDHQASQAERIVKLHPLGALAPTDAQALVDRLRETTAVGIASVVGGGAWEGCLAIAYESHAGRSLRHWIDGWRTTHTPPPQATLKALFLGLCSVLSDAHSRGVAHERLSPRSVVVTSISAPRPVVIFDLGVSELLASDELTQVLPYQAPEQAERTKKAPKTDARRHDLFALGVILAELLTLRATPKPNSRETWEQVVRSGAKRAFAEVAPRPEDVPERVWALVERLLFHRGDEASANPSKIRNAARAAWEFGGVADASREALREAPLPVEEPAPSHPPPRARDEGPTRASAPTAAPEAPSQPARPQIRAAFSVHAPKVAPPASPGVSPVIASPAPMPDTSRSQPAPSSSQPSPTPGAPAPTPSQQMFTATIADVGGDTLVDYDDDEQTSAAGARHLRPGGETLAIDEAMDLFAGARPDARDRNALTIGDGATTTPGFSKAPADLTPPLPHTGDPFTAMRRLGGDTIPLDDVASPLAISSAPTPSAPRPDLTLVPGREPATLPLDGGAPMPIARHAPFVPVSPHEGGDTLPLDHPPAAALAAISPVRAAPVPFPQVTPPRPDRTAQIPALTEEHHDRAFYLKFAAATITGGVVLGVIVTALLR